MCLRELSQPCNTPNITNPALHLNLWAAAEVNSQHLQHRVRRIQRKNRAEHFVGGRLPTYLSDFYRVLGGAAGVELHLASLDDFIKPAEAKKQRAGSEIIKTGG